MQSMQTATQNNSVALYVPRPLLRKLWPKLEPYLTKAIAQNRGEHTLENILDAVLDEQMQLWGALLDGEIVGAAVTQIIEYPGLRVLQILYLGGHDMVLWWQEFDAAMVDAAKRFDCQTLRLCGREGWDRLALRGGYERTYVVMDKRV